MKKKLYILPTIKSLHVKPSTMICGSGYATDTLPGGSTGKEPTPSGGIISGDAKSSYGFDFDDEE